ncbi:hypothetical protein ES703_108060 [subsurface metagenome]
MSWESKPGSCPLRRVRPRGPIRGCKGTCRVFEECVEYTRGERNFEEYRRKMVESLRAHVPGVLGVPMSKEMDKSG